MTRAVGFQFDDARQQHEADNLGMWVFLATEIMLFGGLFTGYGAYRLYYPRGFAEASGDLFYWIGTVNTGVLLTSSVFMALAVHAASSGHRQRLTRYLLMTAATGCIFLGLKGYEYYLDWTEHIVPGTAFHEAKFSQPDHAELFFVLYFIMTGVHALHLSIAVCLVTGLAFRAWRGAFTAEGRNHNAVEVIGLYWHLVDIVWIFLYPMLYLMS